LPNVRKREDTMLIRMQKIKRWLRRKEPMLREKKMRKLLELMKDRKKGKEEMLGFLILKKMS
jgi:hypothetical protein